MSDAAALAPAEALARIRLLRSPHVGPVTFAQLLRRFGDAGAALAALPDLAGRGGSRYRAADAGPVRAEIDRVRKLGARYIFHDSPDYPPLLRMVEGAPPVLIARGALRLGDLAPVAIVGARNSSAAAVKLARSIAQGLAEAGHIVVSGLARGIDGAAHMGALAAGGGGRGGLGGTIAVIASGIDITYPPEHTELQARIAEEGLLLSELPPGTEPIARHFPSRNRIIAGIAAGTLVVEAAPKSGSLITAWLAGEYGREVMAVPGSPLDARSHGCNQLIRDGAVLVQSAADVIELVTSFSGQARSSFREAGFREDRADWAGATDELAEATPANIAALLTTAPVGVDELIRQIGAGAGTAGAVQLALIELELAGRLARHAGGRVSLAG